MRINLATHAKTKLAQAKWDFPFLSIIGLLCITYFCRVVFNGQILVHGDFQYALTVEEHMIGHLSNPIVHAAKIPLLAFLGFLGSIFADTFAVKIFGIFIFFLSSAIIYLANKCFVYRLFRPESRFEPSLCSLIGTLVFLFNPWTINEINVHYWIVLSLASSYGLVACLDYLLHFKAYWKHVLWSSLLLSFVGTQPQSLLIYFVPLVILYVVLRIVGDGRSFLRDLFARQMLLIYGTILLLNGFWILPNVAAILVGSSTPQSYTIVAQNVDILSGRGTILNSLTATSRWIWGGVGYLATPNFALPFHQMDLWDLLKFLPALIASSSILSLSRVARFKKHFHFWYFSLLFIISVIIPTGSKMPVFGDLYRWVFLNAPLGWVIRDPYKNVGLFILSLSALFSFLASVLIVKRTKRSGIALFLIAIVILSWGWPALTGDLNGYLSPSLIEYPEDLTRTIDYLKNQPDIDRYDIFWYTPEPMEFYLQSVPELSSSSLNTIQLQGRYLTFIGELAERKAGDKIIGFFEELGIKYVILRNDVKEDSTRKRILEEEIKNLQNLLVQYESATFGNFSICTMESPKQMMDTTNTITYATSPDLSEIFEFTNVVSQPYFEDFYLVQEGYLDHLIDETDFIVPKSKNYKPDTYWSPATFSESWPALFEEYLSKLNLSNTQTYYDKSVVFTTAASRLEENPTPNNVDLTNQWNFDSSIDLDQWRNHTSENQFGTLYTITLDNSALRAELWNSTWGWKTINSPLITAEYGNWCRWELQVKGENTLGTHIKIVEYDEEDNVTNVETVANVGSGSFDWQTITIDFTPKSSVTKYIQLQIWHGHETTQPLPNKIWIDNVKVYDLQRFVEPVILEVPFQLPETGEYVFLTRLLQNQQGGKIQMQLDDKNYTMNTKDQLNKFTWKELDTLTLQKGQHKITLTNLQGFNAMNLFALIPKQQYITAQNQLEQTLRDTRIIYVLEAESDMYRESATASNKYGGEASNGEVLELTPHSMVWNEVEISKLGNYTVAIRSKGSLNIQLGEKEYTTNSTQLEWTYLGPISLEKGKRKIEITISSNAYYQWNFENGDLQEWQINALEMQTLSLDKNSHEGTYGLKAELNASAWGWKTINSPLIPVTPEDTYQWDFYIAGENAHGVHAKIVEYDINKTIISSRHMEDIGDGNFTWKDITFEYKPTQNATHIQLQIWHGHETTQPLPNKIWIDNVKVYGYQPSDVDTVWLYSTKKENETLEDIFTPEQNLAAIVNYQKIDPTEYAVKINATKPFMLSFAQTYDPLWVGHVNGEGIASIPLYSLINGFWINKTGELTITIEYKPKRWFYYGSAVSIISLLGSVAYLVWDGRKRNHRCTMLQRAMLWLRKRPRNACVRPKDLPRG